MFAQGFCSVSIILAASCITSIGQIAAGGSYALEQSVIANGGGAASDGGAAVFDHGDQRRGDRGESFDRQSVRCPQRLLAIVSGGDGSRCEHQRVGFCVSTQCRSEKRSSR